MLSESLSYLERFPRWINWVLVPDPHRPEKPKKLPVSPLTGAVIGANDASHHASYQTALDASTPGGPLAPGDGRRGVGFVFTKEDGLWFLDMDNCLMPNGQWSTVATYLIETLPGAAWEVSQSGTGLHGFGWASSIPEHGCRNTQLGLELYHADRFVALTDRSATGGITHDTAAPLANVIGQFFTKTAANSDFVDWTDAPLEGAGITDDDDELISIMLKSGQKTAAAHFSATHVAFADLWHADADKLAARWPSSTGPYDASQADSALAAHLLYWTGKDCERTRRLMERSALVREKWEREDYLPRTIIRAAGTVRNVVTPREVPKPLAMGVSVAQIPGLVATVSLPSVAVADLSRIQSETVEIGADPEAPPSLRGLEFMGPREQVQFFAGCVYVQDVNRVWIPGSGLMQDKARFDITFGGSSFSTQAVMRTPEKSAWEAFTRSHFFAPPTAIKACFRPELPSGTITGEGFLNTYVPVDTPKKQGDVSKWLAHVDRLFPIGDDAKIIIAFMAATVRSPGAKHQWCPVIQGAEGNGKTVLNTVMEYSVGSRYCHIARPSAMAKTGNQFNAWVLGKLYVSMEEINVGEKRDFLDEIKDLVTNRRIGTEGKGADQVTGDNRANLMMFTNYKTAVPINRDSRRYAVFYCPQQNAGDLATWGMDGGYFPDLFDWLRGEGVYAHLGPDHGFMAVNYWLHHEAEIDARYDPRGQCQRAPRTSSTDEAIIESLGTVEQEVLEQINSGAQGFADGWVCAYHLDQLLNQMRMGRMSHAKRGAMLRDMGFVLHPGLPEGRVPAPLDGIGKRPRLYVRAGHLSTQLASASAIQAAYEAAQKNALARNVTPVGEVVTLTPR